MKNRPERLTEKIYQTLKTEIFDFRLLPGEHFTESEIAARTHASRTPVREALFRLQQEGFVQVHFRNGWQVKPLDFTVFDELYDLRILIECSAIEKICSLAEHGFENLKHDWLLPQKQRLKDGAAVCLLDEAFHAQLVIAAGNREMLRVHREITERLRIVRRLDFTLRKRISATYTEHAEILTHLENHDSSQAAASLTEHILTSKSSVRKITLRMLHDAQAPK